MRYGYQWDVPGQEGTRPRLIRAGTVEVSFEVSFGKEFLNLLVTSVLPDTISSAMAKQTQQDLVFRKLYDGISSKCRLWNGRLPNTVEDDV